MYTWQVAQQTAKEITGRTARWCDVEGEDGFMPAAPTEEAMNDCIALDTDGKATPIEAWLNQEPVGKKIAAVCYF